MERFYFTDKGLEYTAQTAAGYVMVFTKGKYGDGAAPGNLSGLTELVHPLGDMPISEKTVDGNTVTVQTKFSNLLDEAEPFYLKELGLFAKLVSPDGEEVQPEILVCYACTEDGEYGDYISGTTTEFIINWPFSVSNAANVVVAVQSFVYALKSDLDALESKVDAKTHTGILYRNETPTEPNTIYFVIDEDKPGPEEPGTTSAITGTAICGSAVCGTEG